MKLPETMTITVGKGAADIMVEPKRFNEAILVRLIEKGLAAKLYEAHASVKKDDDGAAKVAYDYAAEELDSLYNGEWASGRVRGTSPVESKALELARDAIGKRLKKGLKVSKDDGWILEHNSEAWELFKNASQKLNLPMQGTNQLKALHAAMIRSLAKNENILQQAKAYVEAALKASEDIEF